MKHIAAALTLSAALTGCLPATEGSDEGDAGPSTSGDIAGTVTAVDGAEVPPESRLVVVWIVSSGSPDYEFLYGGGAASADGFALEFDDFPPPLEALNTYPDGNRLGVGLILALPTDRQLPADGRLDRETSNDLIDLAAGLSWNHGVIYVEGEWPADHWASQFEPGALQCGEGAEPAGDSAFDRFLPVDCDTVELRFGGPFEWVNWT